METKENITKIVLLGETGVGKSSLGNYIIGEEEFLKNGEAKRVTNQIEGRISKREKYKDIYVIDTPGFQDTYLEDQKFIEELKTKFKDKNAGVRAICLLVSFCNPRLMPYLKRQIYIYCLLFSIEDFWEHISIVFTKSYYHFPKEEFEANKKELESENGLINEIKDYLKQCIEKINESKKKEKNFKKIKIQNKLQVFYIDSNLKIDENKNLQSKEEINKLIEWARKKDYLDLQNISENKIDVNYLSSERMKDIIQEDKRFLKGSNELKLYSKKFYAQYKKTTFHNKIIIVKESSPYKIEEIKEEKREQKNLISEEKNYKIYQIHHIAIKAKKRIIENGETKNWENIENKSNIESSRILSTDKLEIITTYEENLINELKEDDKIIQIYKKYKITKEFLNGAEIKHKKELIYTKKISKKIILESTEKKQYKEDMEFCEDIVKEEIITELGDRSEPVKDLKEISRKKDISKLSIIMGLHLIKNVVI